MGLLFFSFSLIVALFVAISTVLLEQSQFMYVLVYRKGRVRKICMVIITTFEKKTIDRSVS